MGTKWLYWILVLPLVLAGCRKEAPVAQDPAAPVAGQPGAVEAAPEFEELTDVVENDRRYIVGIHPFTETEVLSVTNAVILAVRRDETGTAQVVDVATAGSHPSQQARARWFAKVVTRGATEMHVHRLADSDTRRQAIVEDLREDESRAS